MSTDVKAGVELMRHQTQAVEFYRERGGRGALFWQPGTGKTIAELATFADDPMPTVVVCPLAVMRSAWTVDAAHFPTLDVWVLHSTGNVMPNRMDIDAPDGLVRDDTVIVTNYETFRRAEVRRWLMQAGVRRLVVDESSKIKNQDSLISRSCIAFSSRMQQVHLLSGTPAPNGPHEYWAQLRCLDDRPGGLADAPWSNATPNFWRWASHWMRPMRRKVWTTVGGQAISRDVVHGWKFKDKTKGEFGAMLGRRCWSLAADDCIDLPPVTSQSIRVELTKEERAAYDEAKDHLVLSVGAHTSPIHQRALLSKVRQLTCGFAYVVGKADRPKVVEWAARRPAKLAALADLVDTLGKEPVVVWAEHTAEVDAAADVLRKAGRSVGVLDGRTKDAANVISEFSRGYCMEDVTGDGDPCESLEPVSGIDALVCHPKSVGHGVNLQRARVAIFLSLGFSHEEHEQARRRILRKGQERPVLFYYVMAEDTVDRAMRGVLARKERESCAVMRVIGEVVGKQEAKA